MYKQNGTTAFGNLTYEYDKNGNRTKTGGSFACTGVPPAVRSINYNSANHQTTFADKTLTYDNNGNLQTVRVMAEAPYLDGIVGVYYDAARLSNLLSNAKDSIAFCEKCLQYDLRERERLQYLIALAEALRQEELFAQAEKVLEEAFTLAKADVAALPRLYMEIGMLKRLTNLPDEACRSFQQAAHALESHPYSNNDSHY